VLTVVAFLTLGILRRMLGSTVGAHG